LLEGLIIFANLTVTDPRVVKPQHYKPHRRQVPGHLHEHTMRADAVDKPGIEQNKCRKIRRCRPRRRIGNDSHQRSRFAEK
jgi:hypothetical protein